jgi:hypothetical protein
VVELLEHALSLHAELSDLTSEQAQVVQTGQDRASAARRRAQELAAEIQALNHRAPGAAVGPVGVGSRGGAGLPPGSDRDPPPPNKRQKYA